MSDTGVFDPVAEALERATSLDRLQARGTMRLALKQAGFEPQRVRPDEMRAVIERVLPEELASRGIDGVGSLCDELSACLDGLQLDAGAAAQTSHEDVFRRLGDS